MRINTLARKLAEFRLVYRGDWAKQDGEINNLKQLTRYYTALIEADQVIPLFQNLSENTARIIAFCEFAFIKETDLESVKNHLPPKHISDGDVCWIINVTAAKNLEGWGIYHFFRTVLKIKYPQITKVCWNNPKRGTFKFFHVQRWVQPLEHSYGTQQLPRQLR